MPKIEGDEIGIALDMHGCPNRCRHCWLGPASNKHMSEDDLRWAAAQFRNYLDADPSMGKMKVLSWFREPDYSDDYEHLYDLERELSDGEPARYELLSVWRLARDQKYADWARRVGPKTCQITFFGLEDTQDWFYRRKGAFDDCIAATEHLLEAGMVPRWQFFLTKKILPDLDGLMRLIESMNLRERTQALGAEFVMFMHPPDFHGEGIAIVDLCASEEDLKSIPSEIAGSTKRHFGREKIWVTEAEEVQRFLTTDDGLKPAHSPYTPLFFFIMPNWDVYSNMGTLKPWWRLGNLKTDSVETVLSNYKNDRTPAMEANRIVSCRELALRYGDPDSRRVFNSPEWYWLERHCGEEYGGLTFVRRYGWTIR